MTVDLLRFTTAGSVDDGKSTLIGRLLYDSKLVHDDQLAQVSEASRRRGGDGTLDLALLTDGLRAEREQGITIDVAYRYFATDGSASEGSGRRFILADVPGHKQYTRNMVTGASTADLSVVLVDARHGAVEQSRRHAYISALLGIPHLVVAVNKMDLVDFSQEAHERVVAGFAPFLEQLGVDEITFIPISALHGDNVVAPSEAMASWYDGPTLLAHLETVDVQYDHPHERPARFPVQWVVRPAAGEDYRGYAGQISSGAFAVGDEVVVLPAGQRTTIAGIDTFDGPLREAVAPLSVTLLLADDLDVSRGAMICPADAPATVGRELSATVCWMSERPLRAGDRLLVKHACTTLPVAVDAIASRVDVDTLVGDADATALELNDIGVLSLRTSAPLAFDAYRDNRPTGAFILIDEATNDTVGAGMVEPGGPQRAGTTD